jgi:3-hydroxy-9,10-secoandrosta-1,3,5(10)-triene-9,17-dione monooxygenase
MQQMTMCHELSGCTDAFASEDMVKEPIAYPMTAEHRRDAAQRLAALLPDRWIQAHRERCLPDATVAGLHEAGLLRLLQPARWGGAQVSLQEFIDLQNALARQCLSTAWVMGVLNVQSFMLSQFDARAQEDVWGADASALLSSSFMPMGTARRVEGGIRISGQWPYSSGCLHAQWALLGTLLPATSHGAAPEMRVVIVPRSEAEVVDTWHPFGLRGTGSHDLRVENAFVPIHRTWAPVQGLVPGTGPGPQDAHDAPLYRLPWLFVFTTAVAALGIGGAQGALAAFEDTTRSRRLATPPSALKPLDPALLRRIGRAVSETDALEAELRCGVARMTQCAEQRIDMSVAEGWRHRAMLTSLVRRATTIVDDLTPWIGARGVMEDHPVTRFWLDLCAARAHPGNDPAAASQELAGLLLNRNPLQQKD